MDLTQARAIFFHDSRELCDALEGALLDRARYPAGKETYNLLFRTAHTIKGSAGIFGLEALIRFAHVVENVLERLRAGQIQLDDTLISLLLECNDYLRRLIDIAEFDAARAGDDLPEGMPLLLRLLQYQEVASQATSLPLADVCRALPTEKYGACSSRWQLSLRFHTNLFRDGFDPASFIRYLGSLGTLQWIEPVWREWAPLMSFDATECFFGLEITFDSAADPGLIHDAFGFIRADSLVGILPPHAPLSDYRALLERLGEPIDEQLARWMARGALTSSEAEQVRSGRFETVAESEAAPDPVPGLSTAVDAPVKVDTTRSPIPSEGQYIRVEAAKLDRLINRVGELVLASSGTTVLAEERGDLELQESVAAINALVEDIRDDALTLRMVPVKDIFNLFPRMVREISLQLNKAIKLEIEGADTEIDKSMIEKLADPLMHIVRNAVDHGLESVTQRLAAHKPEIGTVTLNAYHDAGAVVVEVRDDGAGIDRDKVWAKALERGLVRPDSTLSDQEIFQFIFQPGFSTAETVSDLSGRGVGMDVVKRNIEALRGEIEIYSKRGEGAMFRLRLPLTLAIIDGFRVLVDGSSFVMPLEAMSECIDLPPDAMQQQTRQINFRGDWLPFISLRELFGLSAATGPQYIALVHYGEARAGIVVDRLVGQAQVVIKPLGQLFKSLRGISGSTILGNGKPALILDIPQLIQYACRREKYSIRQQAAAMNVIKYAESVAGIGCSDSI